MDSLLLSLYSKMVSITFVETKKLISFNYSFRFQYQIKIADTSNAKYRGD